MPNVYYDPESFGLEIVAELEYSSGCYEFDTRVVWKDKKHKEFFTMRDSGCSCPTPFEDYSLANLDKLDLTTLRKEVKEEVAKEHKNISPETAQDFIRKVELATKSNKPKAKKK